MIKLNSTVSKFEENEPLQKFITGKWGCGAYRGDPRYKYILIACMCSIHNRDFVFCPYEDEKLRNELIQMQENIKDKHLKVGEVLKYAMEECNQQHGSEQLFQTGIFSK